MKSLIRSTKTIDGLERDSGSRCGRLPARLLALRHLSTSVLHDSDEPARQFADPVRLPELNGLMRDQGAAYSQGGSARQDEIGSCLLVHSSRGNQRNAWIGRFESPDVLGASDLGAGENLDKVTTGLPGPHYFRWRQGAGDDHCAFLP